MAADISVRVYHTDQNGNETRGLGVANALRRIGGDLEHLTSVHRRIARIISARAKQLAPIRTGTLRRSLRAMGTDETAAVTYDARRAYYAHIVARGHRLPQGGHVPPTDYDVLALEQTRPQWQGEYSEAIDMIIREHGLQ